MFSLYRTWLETPIPNNASTNNVTNTWECFSSPQHVVVTAGVGLHSRRFTAHRPLLAEHSGYIKSLLIASRGGSEIQVPNVSPEIFAPLLGYMYTGFLDLTSENIYAVLLAAHLLHMPRAVDLCRSFLLRQQYPAPPPPPPPVLVKPIPYWPTSIYTARSTETSINIENNSRLEPSEPIANVEQPESFEEVQTSSKLSPKPIKSAITDVACCDGPVRFKRVLNENYGNSSEKMEESSNDNGGTFICQHCNHSFKSHYCYRKHARRHLNPIRAGAESPALPKPTTNLDMNVQYYPCKTCGSKFPSYYFVHKHRKLCHPEENSSNNLIVVGSKSLASASSPASE